MKIRNPLLVFFLIIFAGSLSAQKSNNVYIDKKGVMRWSADQSEVQGFGVNYTVPFAHAYRMAKAMGVDHKEAIDHDTYHFARLGFDLYRVHVWDTEISDTLGNLLDNENLKLFDYQLMKMKERGIRFIITPIAFWGNGWPMPDEKTPGFSAKYGKAACLTNPEAIKAQENYLFQFLNHVNPYTDVAYKDEPDIIAFEVSNEPHHGGAVKDVTAFIDRMIASMRKTGCKKPVFYNMSHSVHLAEGYFNSKAQGGTFQWYPTGLVSRFELGGNLLPNVDLYSIPFAGHKDFQKMARIVYEFDAADVGRSYIYPAMARSFRTAGIQVATHFAYDPTYMASFNTEYGTHYMNLAYAPQKALSLMIAGEAFHTIPMYQELGRYPENTAFGDFRISYENDLAELVSEKKFIYTNYTQSTPPAPDKIELIAGFGSSPLVQYDGTGAYFLDKLEDGVWRLEVMPDAVWVDDPFGRTSPKKTVAVIDWKKRAMELDLPGLGNDFSIKGLNDGANLSAVASGKRFEISPGAYLLQKKGFASDWDGEDRFKNILLKEYFAPEANATKVWVLHKPFMEIEEGQPVLLKAKIVGVDADTVELNLFSGFRPLSIGMKQTGAYEYEASIPGDAVKEGFLSYYISATKGSKTLTFPGEIAAHPSDWDFYGSQPYRTAVKPATAPITLFSAISDSERLSRTWTNTALVPLSENRAELRLEVERPVFPDPLDSSRQIADYSMRFYFGDKNSGRKEGWSRMSGLVFSGRSLDDKACPVQLALVMRDGSAWGGLIQVKPEKGNYKISLNDLKPVRLVTLPRPYPTFLPYYFENERQSGFQIEEVETLQISIVPESTDEESKYSLAIESVWLE